MSEGNKKVFIDIYNYYQVPLNLFGSNPNNKQGIAAFSDYFSAGALQEFDSYFSINPENVTSSGPNCLIENCDQFESDLDVQYMTAMGESIPTLFAAHPSQDWVLDWALQMVNDEGRPYVNSISYGAFGYDSVQYVTRTDQEFQMLGTLGVTILVSSGDDGAPSFYYTGANCPIDPNRYCPVGGCNHTYSECPELTFTIVSNSTVCYFPMNMYSDSCLGMLQDQALQDAVNYFEGANANCELALEQDYGKNYHIFSSCECNALQSIVANGYQIAGYEYTGDYEFLFAPDYPTSSPYVTAVGATQFTWLSGSPSGEEAASILTGSSITTGGGFSYFQPMPDYQAEAVSYYINSGALLPPGPSFNTSNRGYPDVAFCGHDFTIYTSNNTADYNVCPCQMGYVDGTSASSPSFAGLLSLINDQLLTSGVSVLGFVNPALYDLYSQNPGAFNDINTGNNFCNRAYCCQYGYTATTGWDPVGGLGTPVFPALLKYFLSAKGIQQ